MSVAVPRYGAEDGGVTFHTALLDMGPASVDGWLARLVGAELGVEEEWLLDAAAREVALDGRRVPLTKLEFAVLACLTEREGQAVTRAALLEEVWGYGSESGSNVVEAVIRSLRKKLGERASVIETVSGAGYRLRRG